MKTDIYTPPPPLKIGSGENAFSIKIRNISASDRMAICDAVATQSFYEIARAIEPVVTGWEDIVGPDNTPIPFEKRDVDGNVVGTNTSLVFGALKLGEYMRILGAILTFVGFPVKGIEEMVKQFGGGSMDLRPTSTPVCSTQTGASDD